MLHERLDACDGAGETHLTRYRMSAGAGRERTPGIVQRQRDRDRGGAPAVSRQIAHQSAQRTLHEKKRGLHCRCRCRKLHFNAPLPFRAGQHRTPLILAARQAPSQETRISPTPLNIRRLERGERASRCDTK